MINALVKITLLKKNLVFNTAETLTHTHTRARAHALFIDGNKSTAWNVSGRLAQIRLSVWNIKRAAPHIEGATVQIGYSPRYGVPYLPVHSRANIREHTREN